MERKIPKSFIQTNINGYKLVCTDDKFSKPFKTNLGEDDVYSFINSIIGEVNFAVIW